MTSRQEKRISRWGLHASLLERVRTSSWFLPALLSVGAIGLAVGAVALDRSGFLAGFFPSWAEGAANDAARALISGMAGSMITIATVSFSVLIVALSFASGQLGPRRTFLDPSVRDDEGAVRVVRDVLRFEDVVRGGIGEIRRSAGTHTCVTARLLDVLGEVLTVTHVASRRRLLEEEARAAAEAALSADLPAPDRRWIERSLERALASPG